MGHASVEQTADTYGHLLPDRHQAAAGALDGLLQRAEDSPPVTRLTATPAQPRELSAR